MKKNTKILPYLAWASTCIVWGTTYLAIKIGVTDTPPLLFAGLRWIAAFLLFFPFLKIKKYKLPKAKEYFPIAVMGISMIGMANGFVSYAEQFVPSGLAALLITTVPIMVVIIESIFTQGSSFNYYIGGGVLIGFFGIVLILGGNFESLLDVSYALGIAGIFIGVFSWSCGTLYTKYKSIDTHPLMKAAFQMLFAGIAQSLVGLLLGEASSFGFTSDSLWAFIYLLIMGSIFGFAFYIYALSELPASFVSTYAYVNPIIALFVGWLILDESLDWITVMAAGIILAGVYLVNLGGKKGKVLNINPDKL